jgi:transcription initiation factor TFIIB
MSSSNVVVRGTKKNKAAVSITKKERIDIWNKIEDAFMPELLSSLAINSSSIQKPSTPDKRVDDKVATDKGGTDKGTDKVGTDKGTDKGIAIDICPEIQVDIIQEEDPQVKPHRISSIFNILGKDCIYRTTGQREVCDACQSSVIFTDDGFMTCTNPKCSILYRDESLDQSAEWRYYGADDNQTSDPTRCGMPVNPLLVESSYGCKVVCDGGSYSHDMMKIRRYTEWQSMTYKEKSQYDVFQKITMIAHNHGISKMIIDEAQRFHKKISEHKTFRGLNRDGIIAASIYIACRTHNCPRTAKEIATIFNLDNTSATKGCKNAVSIINELECALDNSEKTNFCRTKPVAFIDRYCSRLNVNGELTKVCQFIAHLIEKQNMIPENTPHSIAAGIVYFVAQVFSLNITKKDVNRISEISEVTINKCYKKLMSIKDMLIPTVVLQRYKAQTSMIPVSTTIVLAGSVSASAS